MHSVLPTEVVAAIVHRNLRTEDRSLPIAVARHHLLRRHHLRRVDMVRRRTEAVARAVARRHIEAARRVAQSRRAQAVHAPIRVAEVARVAATRVEDNSP